MQKKIITVKVDWLIPNPHNSRTHSDKQIAKIAASITEFGWTNPILIDSDMVIVAGHGRTMAAKKLGIDSIPAIDVSHLSNEQKRALVIADNQIALESGWDEDILKSELDFLNNFEFNMEVIGFSEKKLNDLLIYNDDLGMDEIKLKQDQDQKELNLCPKCGTKFK